LAVLNNLVPDNITNSRHNLGVLPLDIYDDDGDDDDDDDDDNNNNNNNNIQQACQIMMLILELTKTCIFVSHGGIYIVFLPYNDIF